MGQIGAVLEVKKSKSSNMYKVLVMSINKLNTGIIEWGKPDCRVVTEPELVNVIKSRKATIINAAVHGGKVVGHPASFDRFKDNPCIILSRIVDSNSNTLGYRIVTYSNGTGNIKKCPLKELLAHCNRSVNAGKIPIQNAQYVSANGNKKAYIKAYDETGFLDELLMVAKDNKYTQKPKRVDVSKNEKSLTKLEQIYTKEQIKQLKLGKDSGVDIRIYANPALSAKQMEALRKGLESKVNVKIVANPDIPVENMKWYISDIKGGLDIRRYLNPEYTLEQLGTISLAAELGLDLSIIADINLSAQEMEDEYLRMRARAWEEEKSISIPQK